MARSRPLTLCLAALLTTPLTGCLLAEEDCGVGFVFEDDRCVPLDPPPPFRGGDAGVWTDRGPLRDGAALPEPEPEPLADDWVDFDIALIVDRTPRSSTGQTPSSPGADIDAIQAIASGPRGDTRLGTGGEVLGAMFNDPFDGSLNLDPAAVLGLPDGAVASLGPDGGFVYVRLALDRPLRAGDALVVVERDERGGGDDGYALYLCRTPDSLDACRLLGDGLPGTTRFPLE